jgi:RNA ligase (TIGR02306 family)
MSTFEIKTRTITQLDVHPNAERLELVVIGGYKAVVQKNIHRVGDTILYIPEDSVFADLSIAEKLGVAAYLTGKQKNRVKAIKLRGILSQGIVLPIESVLEVARVLGVSQSDMHYAGGVLNLDDSGEFGPPMCYIVPGVDFAQFFKIEKYEEPIPIEMAGQVRRWPSFLPKFDIENIKRPESMAAMRDGEEVVMTEKLHGTNMTVAVGPGLDEDERVYVCSRNNALKESDSNVYWRAVKLYGLDDDVLGMLTEDFDAVSVSLHGEVYGVQDLKYGKVNGDIGFAAFDIMIDGKFINYDDFMRICNEYGIPTVPVIYRGPYDYETLYKAAHGKTLIAGVDHIREGGVVKPVVERTDDFAGRVSFKFVSEDYLTRKGGSELH